MKMIDDVIIIGIDSGYGNIKTANCCFPASVSAYAKEPVFKENLLVFEGKFYLIGDAIEGQYAANNLHFAAAIAFILMVILLVCMALTDMFNNPEEKEGLLL